MGPQLPQPVISRATITRISEIVSGLASSFMFTLGGAGFMILDQELI
jgi:hypothetical protein